MERESLKRIGFLLLLNHTGQGGVERVLIDVTSGLKKYGIESSLFLLHEPEHKEFLENFDSSYYISTPDWIKRRHYLLSKFIYKILIKFFLKRNIKNIFQRIERSEIDILFVLDYSKQFSKNISHFNKIKKNLKIPIISWIHGTLKFTPQNIRRKLQQTDVVDRYFVTSTGVKDDLRTLYQRENVDLIYNPIHKGELIPRDRSKFLYIGRIDDHRRDDNKRVYSLIEKVSKLKGDWTLDIIGSTGGIDTDNIFLEKLNHLGILSRINFLGWREDPWSDVKSAGILLLNSKSEGFGLVIAEAMVRGIPVLSSNCPSGPSDIIEHGLNGWLYPVDEEYKVTEILQLVLDGKLELPEQETVRESVQKFSTDIIIDNFYKRSKALIKK